MKYLNVFVNKVTNGNISNASIITCVISVCDVAFTNCAFTNCAFTNVSFYWICPRLPHETEFSKVKEVRPEKKTQESKWKKDPPTNFFQFCVTFFVLIRIPKLFE